MVLRSLGTLSIEERKSVGKEVNCLKKKLEGAITEKRAAVGAPARGNKKLFDDTMPGIQPVIGHVHPITQTLQQISDILIQLREFGPIHNCVGFIHRPV